MPSMSVKQLKGNYAENLVAEWLSRTCLIRPVAAGTDIGIDLYCEALIEGSPYLHFWVQVKAITKKNVKKKGDKEIAFYNFKQKHLLYWSKQPVPVYAFLVPVEGWPPKQPNRIYGVPISRYIVQNGIPDKSITLESSGFTDLVSIDNDWEEFIYQVLPVDSAILLFSKGFVAKIEHPYPRFPSGVTLRYQEKILENIRDAAIVMGRDALDTNEHDDVRRFCELLSSLWLPAHMHELGLNFLVESAMKDGNTKQALKYLDSVYGNIISRTDLNNITKSRVLGIVQALRDKVTKH